MIVQRGDFVVANARVPAEKFIRSGLADEFLSGEPINLLHVAVDFSAEGNCLRRSEQNLFARRRRNARGVSGPPCNFAASFR